MTIKIKTKLKTNNTDGEGRFWVRIDSLNLGKTYAGMLEGLPTKDQNDKKLQQLKDRAVK